MIETIEKGACIKWMNRDVVATGSLFLHGLLHAYQSPTKTGRNLKAPCSYRQGYSTSTMLIKIAF